MLWEKKRERKAKAFCSSSPFLGFLPVLPVPLGQLPSLGFVVITMTLSVSLVYVVLVTTAAPIVSALLFVPSADVTPVETNCKLCRVECPRKKEKVLAAFEDL